MDTYWNRASSGLRTADAHGRAWRIAKDASTGRWMVYRLAKGLEPHYNAWEGWEVVAGLDTLREAKQAVEGMG